MDKPEFDSVIELKIGDIIALVIDIKAFDFEKAIEQLYKSGLYRLLIQENTKLWHLSSEKLFDMLVYEKENKQLILPDYV